MSVNKDLSKEQIKEIRRICSEFSTSINSKAWWQLTNTLIPFIIGLAVMIWGVTNDWNYLFILMLALPVAGLYIRLFIIQHDCGHGSFFQKSTSNNWVGRILGVITLFPYSYWKKTHAIHHGYVGNLDERNVGDIDTYTVEEYKNLPKHKKFFYRMYRNPVILLLFGPIYQFVIKHRFPFDMPKSWKMEWKSVIFNNITLALTFTILISILGFVNLIKAFLPIIMIGGAAGIWLFYVQHTFEDTYWKKKDNWNINTAALYGSSYFKMPAILNWFTGNIGFHHIHHLSAKIPNYRLQEAFKSSKLLQQAPTITLLSSIKTYNLKLWDEAREKMISFKEYKQLYKSKTN